MEIYSIENLTFRYPKNDAYILKDITFSVQSGEFITICGVSGSGKSTLLRHFKSCLKPSGEYRGNIYFKGKPIEDSDFETQSQKIGFVMQSFDNQSAADKVWHELSFGLENLSLNTHEIKKRVAETSSFFGIEKWLEMSIDNLSGGQKQILNLASVIIMQPEVIILDEPTSQLDPIASEEFIALLKKINVDLGITVILSEHHLEYVFPISDRIIVMSDGKIISDTTPQNVGGKLYAEKNEMFSAMPAPVRIFSIIEKDRQESPITVGGGRKWLESYAENIQLRPIEKDEKICNKYDHVLELKNIWFRYERNLSDILQNMNLKIYKGEFLAILGGNGAGKTTILSLIAGLYKPYRGKIYLNGQDVSKAKNVFESGIAVLPQNPCTLFIKNTVEEDLYDIFSENHISKELQKQKVENIISLCQLEDFRTRHPYDLSGGEQQKAALAKVLLTEPKILLLDEPTKGFDAAYKKTFSKIIKNLVSDNIAVIAVSHDIEFCAEYADRCAMLFNGEIVSESAPRTFFSGNNFYTTSSSRMSRGIIKNAVTVNDVIYSLGKNIEENSKNDFSNIKLLYKEHNNNNNDTKDETYNIKNNKKSFNLYKTIIAAVCVFIFVFSASAVLDLYNISSIFLNNKIIPYIMIFVSVITLILTFGKGKQRLKSIIQPKKEKLPKRTIASVAMIFAAIPITIFIGVYCFDNKKYLFISLLVMLECMLPFFLIFEKRKAQVREIVFIAVMCTICISGRAVFYMLPQFKPVAALVIISGASFGGESGFLIGAVTMLVSNIFFGQGAWTPWQMFAMGIIGFISGIIYKKGLMSENRIAFSFFGFISVVLIYGGIMNPASLFISKSTVSLSSLTAFYISGLPMDILHGISTAVFLFFGSDTIIDKLERVKIKYGLIDSA